MKPIRMVDLISQHAKIRNEIDQAIASVIDSASFIQGEMVSTFSSELAKFLNTKHVIPCANGTDAIQIALMALDLPKGSEVIVPSFNYVSAAEAVALLGFKPVFCDVDPFTFTIDPESVKALINTNTKAIIPVHLFGQCANMNKIMDLAKKYNLFVIEDNAQSLGATYTFENKNEVAGNIGHIGTTSFFPSKNLGCMGDGGAIYTNNEDFAKKIKSLAGHGQLAKYQYEYVGINSRLDTLQAAILSVKLKYLSQNIEARQTAASNYNRLFSNQEFIETPKIQENSTHTYNQYTLKINPNVRKEVMDRMKEKKIPFMVYYPSPLYQQPAYQQFVNKNQQLPISEELCNLVLSLPIHPELTVDQQSYIAETVIETLTIA